MLLITSRINGGVTMAEADSPARQLTGDELEATFESPSIFCNKFYLSLSPVVARVTFAETRTGVSKPHVRTSITMAISDLVELRNLLNRMLEGKTQQLTLQQDQKDA
jgi:hypothetical protein